MFIIFELWDEKPRPDGSPICFGDRTDAYLDMLKPTYQHLPININAIVSYQDIQIYTVGRPGGEPSQSDCLHGVRIFLANGATKVFINDRDPTFHQLLEERLERKEQVINAGRSAYMTKFGPDRFSPGHPDFDCWAPGRRS